MFVVFKLLLFSLRGYSQGARQSIPVSTGVADRLAGRQGKGFFYCTSGSLPHIATLLYETHKVLEQKKISVQDNEFAFE